ncbi:site-specific integrase [Nitrospirillum bahiense]|uniref:site-specific integrase n=1 Tax=Nitrospirillum amazonense TaxID=28077 RepID=UPI001645C1A9|nr:site-specific integrase [Nitrospirillum amazonense]
MKTRFGIVFDAKEDVWNIFDPCGIAQISFSRLRLLVSAEILDTIKSVIAHYLRMKSTSLSELVFDRFCGFCRFAVNDKKLTSITVSDILAYRASLSHDHEWYLGTLRGFFRTWSNLRLPGLDPEVVQVLDKVRLKGNRKGDAVRSADPNLGPFTEIELQAIIVALNNAFARDKIDLSDYILVQLFLALGARGVQLASLKVCDFSTTQASSGEVVHLVHLPRAKQHNSEHRVEFKSWKLNTDLGHLIERHCLATKRSWVHLDIAQDELPFWPNHENTNASDGLLYHSTRQDLSNRVQAVFDRLNVISERTGLPLNVTTRRFRYTLGTRAAREGLSELVIAEILDHSDIQNVGVYVEAVPEIVERIDRAMAMELAPMAQAFAGVLIDGEDQASRAGDPRSRVVTPGDLKNPVGSCGSYGFCGATAPIACYTCRNFQPWLDGPHEQVLEQLLADRQRIMEQAGDATIASINDRVIYACAEVVHLCQQRMGKAAE